MLPRAVLDAVLDKLNDFLESSWRLPLLFMGLFASCHPTQILVATVIKHTAVLPCAAAIVAAATAAGPHVTLGTAHF
jgi:hypothetical protein